MAFLSSRTLFFTTSPRTPSKMIPEIKLLNEVFDNKEWDSFTQIQYIDALSETDFFEGIGSTADKAFSARDRINRAPKALGFVDLKPKVKLTEAGGQFVYGSRPEEIFLRQLLKFQLPSPYHREKESIVGTFNVKPYLEIFRLVQDLEYLSFDELMIFGMQLTDYKKYDEIKDSILLFRHEKAHHKGNYKNFIGEKITNTITEIYSEEIKNGQTKTRQSKDASLKKFIATKRSNLRDYTDACFRYLRSTGLISISHKHRSIRIFDNRLADVNFILLSTSRDPVFVDDLINYKKYLFNPNVPLLYVDNRDNLIDTILRISSYTKNQISSMSIEELKDKKDRIIEEKRETLIKAQVDELKSYSLYSEVIDTYNEIISNNLYDAPLMLEWNTWRAMTMINGGEIKGNFKLDDYGQPMSTAQGNMSDIECDYGDFSLSVEVTLQNGQRQYETEGEPVARHYGQLKKRTGKETYCLFITPNLNHASLAHFYMLNKIDVSYYGGKAKIIPLELDRFMRLIENSYNYHKQPTEKHVGEFLEKAAHLSQSASNEKEWLLKIYNEIDNWPFVA